MPPALKKGMLGTYAGFLAWRVWRDWLAPAYSLWFLKNRPDDDTLALLLGRSIPSIRDKLANALQVYRNREKEESRSSVELAEASLAQASREFLSADLRKAVSSEAVRKPLWYAALMVLLVCAAGLTLRSPLRGAYTRLRNPGKQYEKPIPFEYMVLPGTVRKIQGDPVELRIAFSRLHPSATVLWMREPGKEVEEIVLQRPYGYRIAAVRGAFEYRFLLDRYKTEIHRIHVTERPDVRALSLTVLFPAYTRRSVQHLDHYSGAVEGVPHTRVDVAVRSNKTLRDAWLLFDQGRRIPMAVNDRNASGRFTIRSDDRYRIVLEDTSGLSNADPIRYPVRCVPDLAPSVEILSPDETFDLDASMTVPLRLEALDDYGITAASIGYWTVTPESDPAAVFDTLTMDLPVPAEKPTRLSIEHAWSLEAVPLFPDDLIHYFFQVFDNDPFLGPKRSRSAVYSIRFPSILEIVDRVAREQDRQVEAWDGLYGQSRELRQAMERFSEELKKGETEAWETKKDLQKSLGRWEEERKKIGELNDQLEQLVERMQENQLLSAEIVQKYQELQDLIREMDSPEWTEAMNRLQESLEGMDPQALKDALQDFQITHDQLRKSIERTLSLFKKLRVEQKLDALIAQIKDLAGRQEAINRQVQQDPSGDMQLAARQETGVEQDTRQFERDAQALMDPMRESQERAVPEYQAFLDTLGQARLTDRLQDIRERMLEGNTSDASIRGSEAVQRMESLLEQLARVRQQLQSEGKERIIAALQRISRQLLGLSQQQETLMEQVSDGERNAAQAGGMQSALLAGLRQAADSLVSLSRETFLVSPEMGRSIGEAGADMERSLTDLQSGNPRSASKNQGMAMAALNRSVLQMQDAMGRLGQSSSGLGSESFFLQLEQMGQGQDAINRQAMDLLGQGRLSMEQQNAMAKLAGAQSALAQRLRNLLNEPGNRNRGLGDLGQLVEEMEKAVEELLRDQPDRRTVERQERILSRLLEAQQSLQEQDYGKERKARTGREIVRQGPDPARLILSPLEVQIQRHLKDLAKEGYTPEYRELIRRYYESLLKEKNLQTVKR
jgi:hypothetical protein